MKGLEIKVTPLFQKIAWAYSDGWPVICNEGGSRSGKTFSTIQLLIAIAVNNPGKRISVVSHSLPHVKRGSFRDFKTIMIQMGRWFEDQWRATDFIYTFKNGSYIELFGLEDEGKARGPARDILFINEANLVSKTLYDQLAIRTTGQIFLDWNPADFNSWVYDLADNPKNKCIHSTYLDNYHNLSPNQIAAIEAFRELPDDFLWKVYGLGQRGASQETIYTAWKLCDELPGKGETFYGLDFGYTNPSSLVEVQHYDGANYVREVIYETGLTITDLAARVKELGLQRTPIYCDSAEPKSIEELYRAGLNVHPSDKDVWGGILKVKSFPLFIHKNSKNVIAEIQSYKWKTDKDGNVEDEPRKANDHSLDALRYAIHTHLRPRVPVFVF